MFRMNILQQYVSFVKNLPLLLERFKILKITNTWQQVLTSRSTGIMGTGISFCSVTAEYKLLQDGSISLVNRAYNNEKKAVTIKGVCIYEEKNIPTCRTVTFDNLPIHGDYWIIYISKDGSSFIVSAPLVILGRVCFPNFGLYVLTLNRNEYWHNIPLQKEITNVLEEYGFTNYFNQAVFSGEYKPDC